MRPQSGILAEGGCQSSRVAGILWGLQEVSDMRGEGGGGVRWTHSGRYRAGRGYCCHRITRQALVSSS